jgi:hypothetical protein
MSHYYVNRGSVLSGRGMIHGADGASAACNYRLQRQEKVERAYPMGARDPDDRPLGEFQWQQETRSQFSGTPPAWLEGEPTLELELTDGRRLPVFIKESQPGGAVVYALTEGGVALLTADQA